MVKKLVKINLGKKNFLNKNGEKMLVKKSWPKNIWPKKNLVEKCFSCENNLAKKMLGQKNCLLKKLFGQ